MNDAPVTRPDLMAEVAAILSNLGMNDLAVEVQEAGWSTKDSAAALAAERARADQAAEESDDWEVKHGQQRRARLAAERICRQLISDGLYWKERADQAEQRIADAPHDDCDTWAHDDVACTCWKSATPTAEQ